MERRQSEPVQVGRLVERQLGDQTPLVGAELEDIVVEARNEDPTVLVLEPGDDPGEGVGRVLDGAAVAAGMEVDGGPSHVDLGVHHPAQADRDRRDVALEEARVADQGEVRAEPVPVRAEPRVEMGRA